MNPRAAINDLHPFQGCPFGQLGYFSILPYQTVVIQLCTSQVLYYYSTLWETLQAQNEKFLYLLQREDSCVIMHVFAVADTRRVIEVVITRRS